MDNEEKELIAMLQKEFFESSKDDFENCEKHFLALEASHDPQHITEIKRTIHSMKGSAKAIHFPVVADQLHQFESFIDDKKETWFSRDFVTVSLSTIDRFRHFIEKLSAGQAEKDLTF